MNAYAPEVEREIRCQFIILVRKDELTPDFPKTKDCDEEENNSFWTEDAVRCLD